MSRAASAHLIVPRHDNPGEESGVAGRVRLERVARVLRFLAAGLVLVFGQLLPSVGALFVVILGVFCLGYGLIVSVMWARSRTAAEIEWAERFTLSADISLVGFALLVFAPDPGWAVYASGFIVIASGGFRFRNGALLAAASLSLTYTLITIYRATALGIEVTAVHMALQLGSYLIAGVLMNAVLPEIDALRQRELDVYEPIVHAQEDTGEALVLTERGRPVYWNKAFEELTGYSTIDLERSDSTSHILVLDEAALGGGPIRAQVRTRDGRSIPVEISMPRGSSDDDRMVWILRDTTERDQAESQLRDRALHDTLTGLPNRALLEDRLGSALATAHRQHDPLCLLLIDLNGFKEVNDTLGHFAGDLVLVEVAKRLTRSLRESDTAARLGGDEFVAVLPATALTGAIETAWTLNEIIAKPVTIGESTRSVSASIGIAAFPEHGRDATSLMAAADAAMYEAKRTRAGSRSYDQLPASA
ncbi:MAG TPA: diguanylate cyclase [Candidatus Limnocylindria bacterium]|nr:diguanylate cyclase [Candidatus Limnocylindria bacterium]